MQRRGLRVAILCVLLACGAFAGFYIWRFEGRLQQLDEQQRSKEETIGRLQSSIVSISTAQQAYTDYGRGDVSTFTRVSLLVDRMTTDAAGLRASDSSQSADRLEEFWTALSALMGAESRARENLAGGDTVGAADAILGSSREHVSALDSTLRAFREAELVSYRGIRSAMVWRSRFVLGATGATWVIGVVVFAFVPLRLRSQTVIVAPALEIPREPAAVPLGIDLSATAAAAADLSRLRDSAALTEWLGRVAAILDARGVIVWMGAGEALFAAAACGYDESVLQRIPPIGRTADNATAVAWRTGELQTVAADASGYGAIVAPMPGVSGCLGVFAAETRVGRENDDTARAVAAIFASQLASVLAAWPAASPTPAEEQVLDRKAAAS
jgi:hypothetical protein